MDKIKNAVTATLGPKEDSTMYLAIAATARAKQGLGYGSTLIKLVTAKVSTYPVESASYPDPF